MKRSCFSLCFIGKPPPRRGLAVISRHPIQLFWNMVSVFDCRVCSLQTVGMQCLSFLTYCLLLYKYRIWRFRLKPSSPAIYTHSGRYWECNFPRALRQEEAGKAEIRAKVWVGLMHNQPTKYSLTGPLLQLNFGLPTTEIKNKISNSQILINAEKKQLVAKDHFSNRNKNKAEARHKKAYIRKEKKELT